MYCALTYWINSFLNILIELTFSINNNIKFTELGIPSVFFFKSPWFNCSQGIIREKLVKYFAILRNIKYHWVWSQTKYKWNYCIIIIILSDLFNIRHLNKVISFKALFATHICEKNIMNVFHEKRGFILFYFYSFCTDNYWPRKTLPPSILLLFSIPIGIIRKSHVEGMLFSEIT